MKSFFSLFLLVLCAFGIHSQLAAQHFSSGATVLDANLSGREWHITSKIDGNPSVLEWNGGAAAILNQPLDFHSTFIIEDGPDDGDGWTPDVRWFHIRNRHNNLYMTVQNASAGSGIVWEEYHGSQGDGMWKQQFRLIGTEVGWNKLRSRLSQNGPDLVLTVAPDGQLTVDAPITGVSPEQKFAFNLAMPIDPTSRYLLVGTNNNDMISDQGFSPENTEVVHVEGVDYSCYWHFLDAGGDYYYMQNALTGNYLSNNGSTTAGDQLYMNQNTSENAKWSLIRNEHTFRFENKVSGYQIGTKGQTANKKPLYQEVSSGIGVKWLMLPVTQEDPPFLEGDYDHLLDGASPYSDCIVFGIDFKKAVCERAGLPADLQWFPVVLEALEAHYQDNITALQALQNLDLHNKGHRAELAFALRNYVLKELAQRPPANRTPEENEVVTYFESKIKDIRWAYSDLLTEKAIEFETNFGINNGGPVLFSDLLDLLNASDFVWPGDYEPTSYQQQIMEEYSSACKTLEFENDHQSMGINIALIAEPMIIPGVAVALNMGVRTGVAALAPAVDYSLPAKLVQAAQASVRTTAAIASQSGNIVTVALIAAQIIAQEAMEAVEVNRLGQRIVEKIVWGRQDVSMYNILTGPNELAKVRLLGDMDFIVGAPLDAPFQYNDNDSEILTPFYLTCNNSVEVELDNTGQATLTPFQVAVPFFAICGGDPVITLSKSQFNCSDLGNHLVTLKAENTALSTSCTVSVLVKDQTAPVISCKNPTIYLDAAGSAFVGYAQVYQGGTDNCGVVTPKSISQTVFGCTHIGANQITVTADDGHGNTASCIATVTVVDNLAPSVTCKPATVSLNANGTGSSSTGDVFLNGTDNCGVVNQVSVAPNSFDCSKIGTNTSTLTINDGHGNQSTCTATITVVDNIAPSVTCKNFSVNLNASGNASIQTGNVFQSGADNCGVVNQESVTPNAFNCSTLGQNTVTLTVNDSHGNTNTCNATVTVSDSLAPTILCKNATLFLNASGLATLTVAQVNNNSFDNCSIAGLTLSQTAFSCANLGTNLVTLQGYDQSYNRSQCTATVTVLDQIKPTSVCKNLTTNLNSSGSVTVTPASVNNGSFDNCSFTQMLTPNTFSCNNVGTNLVTLVSTDAGGNSSSCTAIITVKDLNAPSAQCKNATIYLNDLGQTTLNTNQINNGSTDACGISSLTLSKTQFNCSDIPGSSQTVTLTVKDVNNNISSCNAQVTIKDNLAPTAVCSPTTVYLGANGSVAVYSEDLTENSYDNCSVWSYSPAVKVYTTANIGNNNLSITVKDFSGNGSTCVSVVTVLPGNGNNNLQQPVIESGKLSNSSIDLSVFPNPTSGEVQLRFELPNEELFLIRVFDLTGRLVFQHSGTETAGSHTIPIRLNGMAPGNYWVDFQSESLKGQKLLVVQE